MSCMRCWVYRGSVILACVGLGVLQSKPVRAADFSMEANTVSAQYYYQMGQKLAAQGKLREANEALKKAEVLLLDDAEPLPGQVSSSSDAQQLPAEPVLAAPPVYAPNNTPRPAPGPTQIARKESFDSLVRRLYMKGDYLSLVEAYEDAAKDKERNKDMQFNLGIAYMLNKDFRRAARQFLMVVRLDKRDADAYYNLGVLYENYLNEADKAIMFYSKYLMYAPKDADKELVGQWITYLKTRGAK